ncbi:protein TESPA1 [Rhinatrema bivittatum]|uniref:protein TESPA1 n=1 Tax=Rhinatrema bivittatum TaxID=194408 RepID=UPI0011292958|nr:protein TESPA1 [Rhinatrema bivittatum]XP_029450981.1 protein TESPA1 [Rhinatrema bivittatum]
MESPPVLSPFSWQRRRAWAQRTRHWHTTVDEVEAAATAMHDTLETPQQKLDEVFLEGNSTSKIHNWLQDCRLSSEILLEETCILVTSGSRSEGNSFEDDLTLGAEATVLSGNCTTDMRPMLANPGPDFLKLGHSFLSSNVSSEMTRTCCSISEVLEMCQEDAENILYNLGFACEEPEVTAKIPTRFFQTPSQVKGINFRVFLEAQIRRIEMEDPCLTLASRFKQVETLATTANALCCLYSYVSKTPVQKIAPSHGFWDYSSIPCIKIPEVSQEPKSPVDRLRKAVQRMCLYTSQRDRKHLCKAARRSPAKLGSLEEVVQEVLVMVREDKQRCQGRDLKDTGEMEELSSTSQNGRYLHQVFPPRQDLPVVLQSSAVGFLPKEAAVIPGSHRRTHLPYQRHVVDDLQTEPNLRIQAPRNTMEVVKPLPTVVTQGDSTESPSFQQPNVYSNECLSNSYEPRTKGKNHSPQVCSQMIYSAAGCWTLGGLSDLLPETQFLDDGPTLCSLDKALHSTQRILFKDSSSEMEEVQSNEDEEIKPSNRSSANNSLVKRHKMNLILHADSAQSDSSGFVEDPAPESFVPMTFLGKAVIG